MQYNNITKQAYQGRNQAELMAAKETNGYTSNAWVTFLQAKQLNLKIKKGSHGVSIFKGFQEVTEKTKDGKVKIESRPMGMARVFNLDQTEQFNQ